MPSSIDCWSTPCLRSVLLLLFRSGTKRRRSAGHGNGRSADHSRSPGGAYDYSDASEDEYSYSEARRKQPTLSGGRRGTPAVISKRRDSQDYSPPPGVSVDHTRHQPRLNTTRRGAAEAAKDVIKGVAAEEELGDMEDEEGGYPGGNEEGYGEDDGEYMEEEQPLGRGRERSWSYRGGMSGRGGMGSGQQRARKEKPEGHEGLEALMAAVAMETNEGDQVAEQGDRAGGSSAKRQYLQPKYEEGDDEDEGYEDEGYELHGRSYGYRERYPEDEEGSGDEEMGGDDERAPQQQQQIRTFSGVKVEQEMDQERPYPRQRQQFKYPNRQQMHMQLQQRMQQLDAASPAASPNSQQPQEQPVHLASVLQEHQQPSVLAAAMARYHAETGAGRVGFCSGAAGESRLPHQPSPNGAAGSGGSRPMLNLASGLEDGAGGGGSSRMEATSHSPMHPSADTGSPAVRSMPMPAPLKLPPAALAALNTAMTASVSGQRCAISGDGSTESEVSRSGGGSPRSRSPSALPGFHRARMGAGDGGWGNGGALRGSLTPDGMGSGRFRDDRFQGPRQFWNREVRKAS